MSNQNTKVKSSPNWWTLPADELARQMGVDPSQGLSSVRVERQRERYGSNELEDAGPTSLWTLAWESIRSPMMVLLLLAMTLVGFVQAILKTTGLSAVQWAGLAPPFGLLPATAKKAAISGSQRWPRRSSQRRPASSRAELIRISPTRLSLRSRLQFR